MSKKVEKSGFVCLVYGGCMKQNFVRYFATDDTPEEEFEKYKEHYGSDIRGRYVKVTGSSQDCLNKLKTELGKRNVDNSFGNIFEIHPAPGVKVMKEITGAKKASMWGNDQEGSDEEQQKDKTEEKPKPATQKKVVVKSKKEPEEIENSEEPSDAEDQQDEEPAKKSESKPRSEPKKTAKETTKKPDSSSRSEPKKETKKESSSSAEPAKKQVAKKN